MQDPMSLRDQSGIHSIAEGVTLEWLYDRKVHVVTLTTSTPTAVDAYRDINIRIIRAWPKQEPYLTVQDVSSHQINVSPYMRKQAMFIWQAAKETQITGKNIIALQPNYSISSIMRFLGNANSHFFPHDVEMVYEIGLENALKKVETYL